MSIKTIYLIDGSSFIFRAYYSLPPLTSSDGTPVGAVYGFINMLLNLKAAAKSSNICVIFDKRRKNFRHDIYPEYKANREEAPEDLIPQFPLMREAAHLLGFPISEMENYEADDLIASYVKLAKQDNFKVIIVSSDKDLMQLIDDDVSMYDGMKKRRIEADYVEEKFGVPPKKLRDVLALMGDSSDNIPGVLGVGPKTASKLINEFSSLQNLLENIDKIDKEKLRQKIIDNIDMAKISYELIGLKQDLKPNPEIKEIYTKPYDFEKLKDFLERYNFLSILNRLPKDNIAKKTTEKSEKNNKENNEEDSKNDNEENSKNDKEQKKYHLVTDDKEIEKIFEKIAKEKMISFDTETDSLNAFAANMIGFSIGLINGETYYIPLSHMEKITEKISEDDSDKILSETQNSNLSDSDNSDNNNIDSQSQGDLFSYDKSSSAKSPSTETSSTEKKNSSEKIHIHKIPNQPNKNLVLSELKKILEDDSILKIGQNIKYDIGVLKKYKISPSALADTMLMSYVLYAGSHKHNMDELAERYLGINTISYSEVIGSGKNKLENFSFVPLDKATKYACEDAEVTLKLYQNLFPQLHNNGLFYVYDRLEKSLINCIADMEHNGITIDKEILKSLSLEFGEQIKNLEKTIYQDVNMEFNIGSPKQLGEVLFEHLNIQGGKKSKTGSYSTDIKTMEYIASNGHKVAELIINWRMFSKLKSTYCDALIEKISNDGRIHTSFSMVGTTTGRLSSSDPNLQNIPIRTDEGRKIRRAFIAAPNKLLISADYSQMELRLLADIANVKTLKQAFSENLDIHSATACDMFGVDINEVSEELRRRAKTINFGIIYGISPHGLATRLGIGMNEAKEYIDNYFEKYPGILNYMETTKEFARKHGYVTTLLGRRCHLKDINSKNHNLRSFSERAAINAPLQGTGADIMKISMIKLHNKFSRIKEQVSLLLQVHDELIVECDKEIAEDIADKIKKTMESAMQLSVPLKVETRYGGNWGEIH